MGCDRANKAIRGKKGAMLRGEAEFFGVLRLAALAQDDDFLWGVEKNPTIGAWCAPIMGHPLYRERTIWAAMDSTATAGLRSGESRAGS